MDKNIIFQLSEDIKKNRNLAVVTIVSSKGSTPRDFGASMIVYEDGNFFGTIGGGVLEKRAINEAIKCIKKGSGSKFVIDLTPEGADALCMGSVEILIDVYKSTCKVILLGAGHVSKAVSQLLDFLSIPYIVVDERKDFANKENFPNAMQIILDYPYNFDSKIKIDNSTFILILTRGHRFDFQCLKKSVKTNAIYIGMIGSKSKVKELFDKLNENKIDVYKDRRIFSPVGINCGGKTPQEIAISIVSEILSVKYSTKICHMRDLISCV